tara:strand:+ start:76 stop:570 length:495 start_codon:yes stop_codon:yes gene_type:complete
MPKKIDRESEELFIEYFTEGETAGNAGASAKKAGWKNNHNEMGRYLKQKLQADITKRAQETLTNFAGPTIARLKQLLYDDSSAVSLNCAKTILEMGGFNNQNINISYDDVAERSDEELINELIELSDKIPGFKEKLALIQSNSDDEEIKNHNKDDTKDEKRLIN